MAPKIFITGGTGYIGGTVLDTLVKQHPEYEITALLRNAPANFATIYPNVKVVRGDYDSWDVISHAASNAHVVVHNGNSDHEPSIKAIIDGLLRREQASFLIHLSGSGIVADWRDPTYHGKLNPKIWSDIDDIDEITNRDDAELHRNVDKIIQDAARSHGDKLKTAIVCPPDIYGTGRGPGNTASVFLSAFYDEITGGVGAPFYGGEGTNTRSWVHIEDLARVYLKLVESAVVGGGGASWGVEGYYFAASQEHSQKQIAKESAEVLKKHDLWQMTEVKKVSLEDIDGSMQGWGIPHIGTYMFAANSRTKADRAAKELGYVPSAPCLWDAIEEDLLVAAQRKSRTFAGKEIK